MEKLLLRVDEVGDALGVGRSKAYQLVKDGDLRTVTVGRSRRVPVDELRRYVADRFVERRSSAE